MSSNESLLSEPKQVVSTNANDPVAITSEPKPQTMEARQSEDGGRTISTYSDNESGYQRESNECTEFCMDFFICFGACDACCPASGEGCLSSFAAFVGGLCFACCKC
ncbi:CIC11C00000004534 [Sungouiella intermedia]|uniref:CIC11C00000004534 n=1 Tax=Sungouiella intermedia TaxID=45354 RepID=A0A1L0DGJ7_9ASCO|nr:CIC11C00000004534 [[Candida] intermedia]